MRNMQFLILAVFYFRDVKDKLRKMVKQRIRDTGGIFSQGRQILSEHYAGNFSVKITKIRELSVKEMQ